MQPYFVQSANFIVGVFIIRNVLLIHYLSPQAEYLLLTYTSEINAYIRRTRNRQIYYCASLRR